MIPIRQIELPQDSVVCNYPIWALQSEMRRCGMVAAKSPTILPLQMRRALGRFGLLRVVWPRLRSARFAQCHRMYQAHLFPHCYWNETVVFAFDCWPSRYQEWERFFRRLKVRLVFLTAQASVAEFRKRIPTMEAIWVPEATSPSDYHPGIPLVERELDVLELGRRLDSFHFAVAPEMTRNRRVHRFETSPGSLVFPTRKDFVAGLANSKISVCFPGSMTHPVESGGVETVTHRYFESIASKCIVLGKAPRELVEIFGFNPVIDVDLCAPGRQVLEILSEVGSYQGFVDRNYTRLCEVGTWAVRAKTIVAALKARGYGL